MLLFLAAFSCAPTRTAAPQNKDTKNTTAMKPEKNEDGEWDIDVLDPQFSYFLNAIAKPVSMYSEEYLKNKNRLLVAEWNSYYYSGTYRNILEAPIEYDPDENYGLKFQYKLYQAFVFVQWKYRIRFTNLSGRDHL